MSRILVTGASGFVASNLIEALLHQGDEVIGQLREGSLDWRIARFKNSMTIYRADLRDRAAVEGMVRQSNADIIYHLAHYGGNKGEVDNDAIRETIIGGTAHLYEAALASGNPVRIIHAGSSSEYGTHQRAMAETTSPLPNSEYGLAKLWSTLYGEHLRREKGARITTLRLFSAYGPYEARTRFFPAVILSLLRGDAPTLSNPWNARDFVHVSDVVSALLHARTAPLGVFNIGSGAQVTLKEAVDLIAKELASTREFTWGGDDGRSFDVPFWQADTTNMREVFGWSPQISFEEGVSKTIQWFKEHQNEYA